jgi:ribosomal protein L37AE/L43A
MPYKNLEQLLGDHREDDVFRAAMRWFLIDEQARWRRDQKLSNISVDSMQHMRESKYYMPPKYSPIPVNLVKQILEQCNENNGCETCAEALERGNKSGIFIVPCHHCGKPCKLNAKGDIVCPNRECFFYDR